jgi:hypothetical protein
MSIESTILLENVTAEAAGSTLSYSDKQKGAGYHKRYGGLHTYTYETDSFMGLVKLQGTLQLYPGDNDWVDIADSEINATDDSTIIQSVESGNFTGNFVWIRAAYLLQDGTIASIRYNY